VLVALSLAASTQLGQAVRPQKSAEGHAAYLPIMRRAPGEIYYVATTGNNSNPGTKSQPWRTIQKAADTMEAWDTCIVVAGDYYERVRVTRSGTSDGPISYVAQGAVTMRGFTVLADYIKLTGFDITDTPDDNVDGFGIFLRGSYCTIEANYIHYCTRGGMSMYVEPHDSAAVSNCIIRNNRLYKNAMAGIQVFGRNHLVEGNEVWGTIQYHPNWANPPSWADADGITFFGTGHTFRKNYIHDIKYGDEGNVNPHIDCFQSWGPAYGIIFEQNLCLNIQEQTPSEAGQGFMLEGVSDLIIRNNVIRSFRDVQAFGSDGLTIVNNTFAGNLWLDPPQQGSIGLNSSPHATVLNNIFYDRPSSYVSADSASLQGLAVGYNCVYRSDGRRPAGSPQPNDLWRVNPLFVNAAGGDFHLGANSPCIDRGTTLALVVNDMDGVSRPWGPKYDIGAYEYAGTAGGAPNSLYSSSTR